MDVHVSTMTGKLDGFRAINSQHAVESVLLVHVRERGGQCYLSQVLFP
jgi:hypothetical protein